MHFIVARPWIVLVFGTIVHAKSRIPGPNMLAFNFAKPKEGRKLNGNMIKEILVDSENHCQFKCLKEERCQSYNFATLENEAGGFVCQLSNSDRFRSLDNYSQDGDFKYGGLKSACEMDGSLCGAKGVCIPNYQDYSVRCSCSDGYAGIPCKPKSCVQLLQDGFSSSGVYIINPDGGIPIQVLCDMTTDGGGWAVFQRRLEGSVNFFRGWDSYKNGFGNLNGEFWLGNDNLHRLTAADEVVLRVDLEDFEGDIRYAEYTTFNVSDESEKYRLSVGGYSGTSGDSMSYEGNSYWEADGMQFSTKDQDNDGGSGSCAQLYKGAWWYNACLSSNLNGLYINGAHSDDGIGINWGTFRGYYYSLKRSAMKVKPK